MELALTLFKQGRGARNPWDPQTQIIKCIDVHSRPQLGLHIQLANVPHKLYAVPGDGSLVGLQGCRFYGLTHSTRCVVRMRGLHMLMILALSFGLDRVLQEVSVRRAVCICVEIGLANSSILTILGSQSHPPSLVLGIWEIVRFQHQCKTTIRSQRRNMVFSSEACALGSADCSFQAQHRRSSHKPKPLLKQILPADSQKICAPCYAAGDSKVLISTRHR